MKMAREAGFDGIQITDGGGYLQPHPLNPGFVEYERFGLDLRRKDSFPLTDRTVQTLSLIHILHSIKSMHRLIQEIQLNIAYL